jgi:hypothetical protein
MKTAKNPNILSELVNKYEKKRIIWIFMMTMTFEVDKLVHEIVFLVLFEMG